MNGYDVLARILKMQGLEFLSVFPNQPLIDSCAEIGIRPIICRQERTGVNIADGFSRISNGRKFGVFSIGAKLAAPEKQVVNIMGDAAFGMSGLDLETAVRSSRS